MKNFSWARRLYRHRFAWLWAGTAALAAPAACTTVGPGNSCPAGEQPNPQAGCSKADPNCLNPQPCLPANGSGGNGGTTVVPSGGSSFAGSGEQGGKSSTGGTSAAGGFSQGGTGGSSAGGTAPIEGGAPAGGAGDNGGASDGGAFSEGGATMDGGAGGQGGASGQGGAP